MSRVKVKGTNMQIVYPTADTKHAGFISITLQGAESIPVIKWSMFGFSSNTFDAIIEFLDYAYSSLDKIHSTIVAYLDFPKAFDTVNHDILMSKLQHNGNRCVTQSWYKFYLSNRKHFFQ